MFKGNVLAKNLSEEKSTIELELKEASIYSIKNKEGEKESPAKKKDEDPVTEADRALNKLTK